MRSILASSSLTSLAFLFLFHFIHVCRCQRSGNSTNGTWINPSGASFTTNKRYTIGQTVRLQWETAFDAIKLCLYPDNPGADDCELILNTTVNPGDFDWTVNTTTDYMANPRYIFTIWDFTEKRSFTSPGVNIYPAAAASTDDDARTNSTEESGDGDSGGGGGGGGSGSDGLDTAGKVGIGIGVPFAFVIGCALAYMVLRCRAKQASGGFSGAWRGWSASRSTSDPAAVPFQDKPSPPSEQWLAELPVRDRPVEAA